MIATLADVEMWRHFHSQCWQEGTFRSWNEARFVHDVHGGHGPTCLQHLSAGAYIAGFGDDHDS